MCLHFLIPEQQIMPTATQIHKLQFSCPFIRYYSQMEQILLTVRIILSFGWPKRGKFYPGDQIMGAIWSTCMKGEYFCPCRICLDIGTDTKLICFHRDSNSWVKLCVQKEKQQWNNLNFIKRLSWIRSSTRVIW